MSLILNIETATICSVAISRNGKVISLIESEEKYVHAEKITVFIQNALNKASISLEDITAIAIGSGPGSYTGLRIGTSAAKGLCYALEKPLISISTLQAMAFAARQFNIQKLLPNLVPNSLLNIDFYCPMIDARRLEVYTALYNVEGNEIMPPIAKILDELSFSEYLKSNKIAFFGDGMPKMKKLLTNPNFIYIDNISASAANMAFLAEEAFQKNDFKNLAYYEPFYLKDLVVQSKSIKNM